MRWAVRQGRDGGKTASTDQCMPQKTEWVGGQGSNRLFSVWRAVKSLGMERLSKVARESRAGVMSRPTRLSTAQGPGRPAVHAYHVYIVLYTCNGDESLR
jgi:hypothetical protein